LNFESSQGIDEMSCFLQTWRYHFHSSTCVITLIYCLIVIMEVD